MLKLRSEEVRLIIILLFAWIVNTEKIYFARYLNTELFPLRSHKVVGDSVSSCIDKCKSSNDCNYINYHVASHLCQLIDGSIGHGVIISDILVQARGYVFGNKANWTMNVASGCLSCQGDGKCSVNIKKGNNTCSVSGCRPPDSKPDAFIMGNMHGVGNKVKYGCTGQLKVAGARQPISTCLESGNWSSTDFQCLLDCGPLPSVEDGTVSLDIPGITTEGARATVFCNPGYAPRNVKIYCQSSGNWDTPLCLQTHNFTCKDGTSWKYASSATCNCVLECSVAENRLCLCTEYQERFISFQNHFILGNNIRSGVENKTDESCIALCRDTLGCRSTDMSSALCYLNTVMPHEVIPGTSITTTLSLRMCDPCN